MHIVKIRHKGLRQLYEDNNPRGVQNCLVDKLRKQLFALETAASLTDLSVFPGWRLHPLQGNLSDFFTLTVSGNWRLIFQYDEQTNTASMLDLLDYH